MDVPDERDTIVGRKGDDKTLDVELRLIISIRSVHA